MRRLGLLGSDGDPRLAWAILAGVLLLYAVSYAAFYPREPVVADESNYLEQTALWVETGSFAMEKVEPISGAHRTYRPGNYPVGMVALMALCVKIFGPNAAFLASFLSLVVAVLVTARWLSDERRPVIFALMLLAFPAALVGGRLAMSDTARAAAAALGLWLFFRGLDRERRGWWLASGFVAGAALTLRESSALPFIPLFAGSMLRRDRGWTWLLIGGLAGTALHLVTNQLAFGNALFVKGTGPPYHLALGTIHERLPLYLIGLLVLVPGGLAFGLAYRGRRRPEIVATIVFFFLFYLGQTFGMISSGFTKRLVVGLRYFDALLPVLAFAMAESMPRLLGALLARLRDSTPAERLAGTLAAVWLAGVAASAFVVHPALDRWSASQAEIRRAIEQHVPTDAVLIFNGSAVRKFIDELPRPYATILRDHVSPEQLELLQQKHGGYVIVLLDRSDSAFWRKDAAKNAAFIEQLGNPEPIVDMRATPTDRLRIWRIGTPAAGATSSARS